jgi:hypothetical protein
MYEEMLRRKNLKAILGKWWRWVAYAAMALLVMGPMLMRGFVLTLDMVFTPKLPVPHGSSNAFVWQWALHIINFVFPGQVIEKSVIFVILLLCGIGMHRLVETKSQWPRYFAGLFYTINPFTYERWMAGQYLVLFGYALLPFLVKALVSLYSSPSRRNTLRVVLWFTAIALVSVHFLVLGALLAVIMFVVYMLAHPSKENYYRDMWRSGGLIVLGVVVLNSYWLIGVLNGHSPISQTIDSIGNVDLSAFTTAYNVHAGLFFNVLSMYGFWLERFGRYAMPNHILILWYGGFALIAVLVVSGAWKLKLQKSLLAVSLAIAAVIGLVMALGVEAPFTGSLTRWVITHVPLMKGFREPEKFSALLVLAYAYFAAWGLQGILDWIPAKAEAAREWICYAALLLPLVYVSTMAFGFVNQLKPVNYPASWYSFNKQLQKDPPTGKLLFLPWHEYMSYDFTPRIIANPAPDFFYTAQVISGTNAQFGGLNDPTPTLTSTFIENQVLAHTNLTTLGIQLAKLHIQYVLLANGYDVSSYGWLNQQTDLKLVSRQPGLAVYQNRAYHG